MGLFFDAVLATASASESYGVSAAAGRSHVELLMAVWLDAARVAPSAFSSDYAAGGCSYGEGEYWPKDAKDPAFLYLDADRAADDTLVLLEATLNVGNCTINPCIAGEGNVAGWTTTTTVDARRLVLRQILCDSEARRHLFGPSEAANGYALAAADPALLYAYDDDQAESAEHLWLYAISPLRDDATFAYAPVRVGACEPDGTCTVVWHDTAQAAEAPAVLYATNGDWAMDLVFQEGEAARGLYQVSTIETDRFDDCTSPYWFVWESGAGFRGTFPEVGALTPEGCGELWTERPPLPPAWFTCSASGEADAQALVLAVLGLIWTRRRSRA